MLKHAGSTGEINMNIMFGLSLRGGMYMSGQIKADVYMKNRLHLRWGMYMRSSTYDRGRPAPKYFTLLLDASCRMISCNTSFAAAWTTKGKSQLLR